MGAGSRDDMATIAGITRGPKGKWRDDGSQMSPPKHDWPLVSLPEAEGWVARATLWQEQGVSDVGIAVRLNGACELEGGALPGMSRSRG